METQFKLGGIVVDVFVKDIKNIHLSVYPPMGSVRISAPKRMSIDRIRLYAISRIEWIKRQQKKVREQERETPREYIERESHYVWGRRYLLTLKERDEPPSVELKPRRLVLGVRPGTPPQKREALISAWYREQVKSAAAPLLRKWEKLIGIHADQVFVQRMKTKWGSCNHAARTVRLNTELAKKPPECLEYIVVHELVHLIEPTHNGRFVVLMDQLMPRWESYREVLNRLPLRQETWNY